MKIILLYDCPRDKCTKMWVLYELVGRGYQVEPIYNKFTISHVEQRGILGRLAARILVLLQAFQALIRSDKNDIFFCWNNFTALYLNFITNGKRKIISYNWLTPTPRKHTLFLYQKALNNPMLAAVINYKKNKELLLEAYQVKDQDNIYYIPDVYDNSISFREPVYVAENKYVFTGGRANRDWVLFLNIARECSDIKFVAVAAKSDWDTALIIPDNVTMYYDISEKHYYELLEKSYMTIYPLLEDRVSGLVNIIKSLQLGKLVITSNISAAKFYFNSDTDLLLIDKEHKDRWINSIRTIYYVDEKRYYEMVIQAQNYIKENFSPQMAGMKIGEIIRGLT